MHLLTILKNFVIILNKTSVEEIISKENVNFGDKISDKPLEIMESYSYGNLKWQEN